MTNLDALVDFLLARIAERGELARRMDADGWSPGTAVDTFGTRDADELVAAYWDQVADPALVLEECEGKRRIVGDIARVAEEVYEYDLLSVLRWLALPHAGHPDYQEVWRP